MIQVLKEALHQLGCSEDTANREAYIPMIKALFSHPGLDLKVRALPHGFLQQNIVVTGLPNNLLRDALTVLAEKRGMTFQALMEECAPMAGKPTNSALFIVVEQALWSKDYRKVGLLLEMNIKVDDKVKALLSEETDPHDEYAQIRKKCGGKSAGKKILSMLEEKEEKGANWKYVDSDPAGVDAPPSKRQRRGPRQFYK
eukprot:2159686-Rhodomonas_salina.1